MPYFYAGDKVKVTKLTSLGGKNKLPKGLNWNKIYTITDIRRGIDGAYDYDDVTLEGISGKWCEFDFELVKISR